jgi:hypothetical protein
MRSKLTALAVSAMLLSTTVLFAQDRTIHTVVPFDGSSLAVNSTNYSPTIDLWGYQPFSFNYALQLQATNATSTNVGIVAVSCDLSNDGVTFPLTTNIVSGFSFTNSPTAGGNGLYQFSSGVCRYLRFKAIVTTTNSFLKAILIIQ